MKKNKMANCYGPLNHAKACDYCILARTRKDDSRPTLFLFYAGKPFFDATIGDGEPVKGETVKLWLEYYAEMTKRFRKSNKWLARYYWNETKAHGEIIGKFTPNGELIKDYTEGK